MWIPNSSAENWDSVPVTLMPPRESLDDARGNAILTLTVPPHSSVGVIVKSLVLFATATLYFNPAVDKAHPYHAIRIKNVTNNVLPEGRVTIYKEDNSGIELLGESSLRVLKYIFSPPSNIT